MLGPLRVAARAVGIGDRVVDACSRGPVAPEVDLGSGNWGQRPGRHQRPPDHKPNLSESASEMPRWDVVAGD
eukprot:9490102-Pyramimonas_sp.AAC.1